MAGHEGGVRANSVCQVQVTGRRTLASVSFLSLLLLLLPFFMNKLRRIYVQSFVCANAKVAVAVADEAGKGGGGGAMKVASGV